ncbi:EAL domain-containing protein [Microvirga sp. KLBC 81]|uniref:sensor domain-containing phosphodiesterase n=1 Tax=Microvirga sp. KLBC 81 TaxID=1862707 RepID=UPI001403EC0A|nr:EAL domain-containing protein [Microvirga sp. KLBC 81]
MKITSKNVTQQTAANYIMASGSGLSSPGPDDISRVLHAVRAHLGMHVAFVSEFVAGRRVFRYVDGSEGELPIKVGDSDPLDESYCHYIVDGRVPQLLPDPSKHPITMAMPVTTQLPVGGHLSVPVRLKDGRVYGTFCCFNYAPDHSLNERDLRTMRAFAEVTGHLLDRDISERQERDDEIARINSVIEHDQISIVYQPIYKLDENTVAGFEGLARFPEAGSRPPNEWFAAAAEVGLGVQLETIPIAKALAALPLLPPDVYLAVNVSPTALASRELAAVLDSGSTKRIVLEVTEHTSISDYAELRQAIEPLRRRGLRLAVDDAGAGYASLQHILSLMPDVIKMDASLTRNIDRDPARRALASSLITFAKDVGSQIIAEGIETAAELDVLRDLGVILGQGYFLGRPMPFDNAVQLIPR